MQAISARLREFLKLEIYSGDAPFDVLSESDRGNYRELLIQYRGRDSDAIPAFLLIPKRERNGAAVLVHHQHNGERHLGKSEVAGRKGDPLQAFGPALAERGFVVLAPDSICFEDRRFQTKGTEPDEDADWLQHFNEMTYRLITGDTLMRKVLDDASYGLSLLTKVEGVDQKRVGVLGHSYGGNTALFQAAVDGRVRFACSSGAVCSFRRKMEERTGLEMALAIPSFCQQFEIDDVLGAIAPRKLLIVSATDDKYSRDADLVAASSEQTFARLGAADALDHFRYSGVHALTQERFDAIIKWFGGLNAEK